HRRRAMKLPLRRNAREGESHGQTSDHTGSQRSHSFTETHTLSTMTFPNVVIPCAVQRVAVRRRHGTPLSTSTSKLGPVLAARHSVPRSTRDDNGRCG